MQRGRKPKRERKVPVTKTIVNDQPPTTEQIPETDIAQAPTPGIGIFTEEELFGNTPPPRPVFQNTVIIPELQPPEISESKPIISETTSVYAIPEIQAMSVIQLRNFIATQHPEWNDLLDVYYRADLQNKIMQRLGLIA